MTPWTVARQAPLAMEFFSQKYWNRLPFPTPGHLPNPGIKPMSLVSLALAGGVFTIVLPRKPHLTALLWYADLKCLLMFEFACNKMS